MGKDRGWIVLFVGGASGAGKSCLADVLAHHYGVSVLKIDDIGQALKAVTTNETLPMLHYFSTGVNWMEIGVEGNVDWLVRVSKEIEPALRAIAGNHLEEDTPVIIEGDFLTPSFAASFASTEVKSLFVLEANRDQTVRNFLDREGGDRQHFRADISTAYGAWLSASCVECGVPVIASRPWDTALDRAIACLAR